MGTEIAMFILTAFDRPPKEYAREDVFPVLDSKNPGDRPDFQGGGGVVIAGGGSAAGGKVEKIDASAVSAVAGLPQGITLTEEDTMSLHDSIQKWRRLRNSFRAWPRLTEATQQYLAGMQAISEQMVQLKNTTQASTR